MKVTTKLKQGRCLLYDDKILRVTDYSHSTLQSAAVSNCTPARSCKNYVTTGTG